MRPGARMILLQRILGFGVVFAAWLHQDATAFLAPERRRRRIPPRHNGVSSGDSVSVLPCSSTTSRCSVLPIARRHDFTVSSLGAVGTSESENDNNPSMPTIKEVSQQSRPSTRRENYYYYGGSSSSGSSYSNTPIMVDEKKLEWLQRATDRLVSETEPGSLGAEGKWHEAVSLLNAWTAFQKTPRAEAATNMEALLKLLVDEQRQEHNRSSNSNNNVRSSSGSKIEVTVDLYNKLLDAWACAAHFRTVPDPVRASQRARQILVTLQENYEQLSAASSLAGDYNDNNNGSTNRCCYIQPDAESFRIVLHLVSRVEGALTARRLLAWMEYLHKSRKNADAEPTRSHYIQVLDAYARPRRLVRHPQLHANAAAAHRQPNNNGVLAEAFLRHMQCVQQPVDTLCYNIAIKAWTTTHNRRAAAEHADRILDEMKEQASSANRSSSSGTSCCCAPDVVTYASVISAWAASGMKAHAVSRAEELLREIEESDHLEANTVVLNSVMSAWVKAKNPAAVDRTEEILRQMEASDNVKPDLISYNTHLHALSMHASPKRPTLAQRADHLLELLEGGCDSGRLPFGPNVFSYNLVIEAFCRVGGATTAIQTARLLRKLIKRDGVEPDSFSFNQVLAALSRNQNEGAAKKAEELLRYMDESHKTGVHPNARPDAVSFASVIAAYTRSGREGCAMEAERLLGEMKERSAKGEAHLTPSTICYNSVIDCWAKSGGGTFAARKAEALLQEMREVFDAGGKIAPNLFSYNGVMNAWARSGTRCSGSQAEKYLKEMWELYNAGDKKVKPNDFSYNTVINAISKSKHESKGQKALRILRRMDKLYQAGNKEARPNEITYTAVINSCAFPSVLDSRTRRKALDTALFTLKELQASRYGHPNQVTYGTFIKACANLLHDDEEMRRDIIKRVFWQCCRDGQLGDMVLNYLPNNLQQELLADFIHPANGRISIRALPPEWRRNVRARDTWRQRPRQQQQKQQQARSKPSSSQEFLASSASSRRRFQQQRVATTTTAAQVKKHEKPNPII